jgi:hypothetical protein
VYLMAIPLAINGPQMPPPAPRGVQWIDVATAAGRMGVDDRTIRRKCVHLWAARGLAKFERPAGLKPQWMVREDADPLLARVLFPDALAADLSHLTDGERAAVRFKVAVVAAWDDFFAGSACRTMTKAAAEAHFRELLAAGTMPVKLPPGEEPPAARTLRAWVACYRADGAAGLVDGRTTRQQKPTNADPFFEFARGKYLDLRKRSVKLCHELAQTQAELSGWMPRSFKQTQRYLAKLPPAVVIRYRDGAKAFDDHASAHVTRDYSTLRSNEIWCSDHHQFDVMVIHRGKVVRPWVTGFMDVRSRKIVGWTITATGGNTDTILDALAAGIDSHGVPEEAHVDNGKDYDSSALQGTTKRQRMARRRDAIDVDPTVVAGVFGELRVKVTHALPYNAKAKPIERMFGTVCGRFSKLQSTYCGNRPSNRPEDLQAKLDRNVAPSLEEFTDAFSAWLTGDYHGRAHTGDAMEGRTPAEVFDACLTTKRTAPAEVRRLLLWKPSPPTKVTKNGVRAGGVSYGQADLTLFAWIGREVIVRVDRQDVGRAAVCEPSGRLICFVQSNRKLPFKSTPEEYRAATAANKRQAKKSREYHEFRPRIHDDTADVMWQQRAEATAAKLAANPAAPPTLVPLVTPLNDQLPALERALNDGPRPPSAGRSIDLYGADVGAADSPAPIDDRRALLEWAAEGERREREEGEQAEAADPFSKLGTFFYERREAAGE